MEGLGEIVVGAELHRLDSAIDDFVGAHHHDDGGGRLFLDLAEHFNPIDARQNHVDEREIGLLFREHAQAVFAIHRDEYVKAFFAQGTADGSQRERFVIDNQD